MNEQPQYPPDLLLRYPHMFPLDIAIWERFIVAHAANYRGFDYDVKVGSGTKPVGSVGANYANMQRELSRYRIDVVAHRDNLIEVLEVKPNASASALGQVITYVNLFVKDYPKDIRVVGGIVTDREMPDIRALTVEMGMTYYIV